MGRNRDRSNRTIRLTWHTERLVLARPYRLARGAGDHYDVVRADVAFGGVVGHGEATPLARYGETVDSAARRLAELAPLLGDDPWALDAIGEVVAAQPGEMAARAALDAALHDLCGKLAGVPVWRWLGVRRTGPPTAFTIWLDEPEAMATDAAAAAASGRYRLLKLKLGGADGRDAERVAAVRRATGLALVVDVNEYWSFDEALELTPRMAAAGVLYVEQPLPAGDPQGPELKRRSALPIYVDEDCHTASDVAACAERAHGVNVKLAKSGGIREALRAIHAARALGLGVMLGCMGESTLGIAAACTLAGLADHVDLDGNLSLAGDPWTGVALVDGVQVPSARPGLGVAARSGAAGDRQGDV